MGTFLGVLISALAVVFLPRQSHPAERVCISADAVLEKAQAHPNFASALVLSDVKQIAAANRFFNAIPPESNTSYDLVVLVEGKNGLAAVYYGRGGEFCDALILDQQQQQMFRLVVLGRSS